MGMRANLPLRAVLPYIFQFAGPDRIMGEEEALVPFKCFHKLQHLRQMSPVRAN